MDRDTDRLALERGRLLGAVNQRWTESPRLELSHEPAYSCPFVSIPGSRLNCDGFGRTGAGAREVAAGISGLLRTVR